MYTVDASEKIFAYKMASPTLDLLCCLFRVDNSSDIGATIGPINPPKVPLVTLTDVHGRHRLFVMAYVFFITVLLSSSVSIIGTLVTLIPKPGTQRTKKEALADDRQRTILSWLAFSDLMACVGIITFSIFCMVAIRRAKARNYDGADSATDAILCIIFTVWVQFFYLATYFWSFVYALDVYLVLKGVKSSKFLLWFYCIVIWLLSAIIIFASLKRLYHHHSGFQCHSQKYGLNTGFVWGSYCALLAVFVAMPIFYFLSSRMISPMLKMSGVYTDKERKIKAQIQKKFLRIVVVFFVCWGPNIVNIIVLAVDAADETKDWKNYKYLYFAVWLTMAIFNPMQAFFNALVYWGPAGCRKAHSSTETSSQPQPSDNHGFSERMAGGSLNTLNGERTPLLRSLKL